jgi:hypothetical protein
MKICFAGSIWFCRHGHFVHGIILRLFTVDSLLTTVSLWRGAGAADRGGLENRCGGDSTQGSNPCPSAIKRGQEYTIWHDSCI